MFNKAQYLRFVDSSLAVDVCKDVNKINLRLGKDSFLPYIEIFRFVIVAVILLDLEKRIVIFNL